MSKQIFIEDRSKREEIPIHCQEDYELESALIQYYRDIEMEYWYKHEMEELLNEQYKRSI